MLDVYEQRTYCQCALQSFCAAALLQYRICRSRNKARYFMLYEGITMRNARQKELLSTITDTQINFTSQEEEIQKYHTYSELSVSEATPGTS